MYLRKMGIIHCLWSHREDQATEINEKHTNKKYLPNTMLPSNLMATSDFEQAIDMHQQL